MRSVIGNLNLKCNYEAETDTKRETTSKTNGRD